ncbi:MAG: carbohydrate kinase family protein, partial [Thermodesulfobacteriota bacterium]
CAKWAKEEGIPTVLDIDKVEPLTPRLIQLIDFVITSSRFPALYTGLSDPKKALLKIQEQISGFLCATWGSEGAMALVDGEIFHVGAPLVKVVDTTGAGDVFHAGFIYGLLQNWELGDILRFANWSAGLKCREMGGRKGIPSLKEVQKFRRGIDRRRDLKVS